MKRKSFYDDEAVVIGYTDGKGRHEGRIGALVVKYNGIMFELGGGLTDTERETPPPIGSVVTFRYRELTPAGVPREARYLRRR